MYRKRIVILLASMIAACLQCSLAMAQQEQSASGVRPIAMPHLNSGTFDPSLADTPPGERAWMSYSAVDPSPRWPQKNTRTITTRLAYSDDAGRTWNDLGAPVNGLTEIDMGSGKGGSWNSEVSSLVFDPGAPPHEQWKLFWHHYLMVGTTGQYANGWIGYRAADTPRGLLSAPEVKLFGTFAYKSENNMTDGATGSPVPGAPLVDIAKMDPSLKMCVAMSEPGAMATPSGLYMSIDCYAPKVSNVVGLLGIGVFGVQRKTILLKCEGPPQRQDSWRYIATLLTSDDAQFFGKDAFTGSDLFSARGHAYLLASPVSNKPWKNAYNGCYLFRFASLETGTLEREQGHPLPLMKIHGFADSFNGACTYQASVPGAGFLFGQVTTEGRPVFHIYTTGPREFP